MTDSPDRREFFEQVRQRFFGGPWTETLGLGALDLEPGRAVVHLDVSRRLIQAQGVVQGGFLVAIADAASSMAVLSQCESPDQRLATIEIKVNFLEPVREGERVRADARVVRQGRRIVLTESRVETAEGRLVAQGLATFMLSENREDR